MFKQATCYPARAVIDRSLGGCQLERDFKASTMENWVLALTDQHEPKIESIRNLRTAFHFGMMDVKRLRHRDVSLGKANYVSGAFSEQDLVKAGNLRRSPWLRLRADVRGSAAETCFAK